MLFSSPIPFRQALQRQQVKSLLPTTLSSAELSDISTSILERAMFSARVVMAEFLQQASDSVSAILTGKTSELPAIDLPTARLGLKQLLQKLGYTPEPDQAGTIQDLRTDQRLNLILETNTQMAQGYGWWEQGQDAAILDEWPAQELIRAEDRLEKRNWYERWRGAGGTVYPGKPEGLPLVNGVAMEGRCIALKNDPIWEAISAFGQPYPPFDFRSGVDVADVSRSEAMDFGLIDATTQIAPETRDFNADLQATPDVRSAALRTALECEGYTFDGDILMPKAA